ncbi:redoxin domain-containing protein [Haloarcula sediminis]|uniref:redoxin domain-containing protein n=1 Tax=Haloarcula sediminis TaxID=3111777 RepID=UPI002D7812D3|nr:redoxin domain-containing protein [Haloarcula sp. CK38]
MLSEGATAPGFELPALVDGEKRRVALSEYLGDDAVILAFYPADFNPACDEDSCDLDELDLFTMQKDVRILGISPDSVYSHRAFAARYDLAVPLLSDTDGEVARQYGIDFVDDIGQSLIERAVAVVDHDGTVTYSWSTDDMTELPAVEKIQGALAETGGDDTAFARYRVGHAHYTEGRRAFTSAMEAFQQTEWVMSQHDFQQAREEFEAAADRFDTAVRFVDDESLVPVYRGANEKATALWQAADWLAQSASAYSSGSGTEGQELRDDAEIPLSTVREYREPPDPDGEWPPEVATLERDEPDDDTILPAEGDDEDAALTVDIDAEVGDDDEAPGDDRADEQTPGREREPDGAPTAGSDATSESEPAAGDDIDDEELAEIQAELAADNPESEPPVAEESTAIVETPPTGETGDETEGTADGVPEEPTSIVDPPTDAPDSDPVDETDAAEASATAAGDAPTDTAVDDGAASGTTADRGDGPEDGRPDTARAETADGSEDPDAGEGEPGLQLELAEPEADPIDADGPPIPPAEESGADEPTGSDGESGSDE